MKNVIQALIAKNGGYVLLPPDPDFHNINIPDISKPDSAQLYDIGAWFYYNNCWYVYSKAGGTVAMNMGAKIKDPQTVSNETVGAAAAQYATELIITVDSTDGPSYDGTLPKDYLKGGDVVVFLTAGATYGFKRGILRNTAVASGGGTSTLTLDMPIPYAVDAAATAEAQCHFARVVVPNTSTKLQDNLCSVAGIPVCRATSGQWLWLQTWGPCWTSPDAALGAGASNRDGRFNGDGSISDGDDTNTADIEQQAGWVIANDKGAGQGAPFVYLQIAKP